MITFLNDRDWQLRAAFFHHICEMGAYAGNEGLQAFLLPCLEQVRLSLLTGIPKRSQGFRKSSQGSQKHSQGFNNAHRDSETLTGIQKCSQGFTNFLQKSALGQCDSQLNNPWGVTIGIYIGGDSQA